MNNWKFFTDEEMNKWVGPRCPDVEPGCAVCKAWTRRDLLRQWEYEDEQDRLEFSQYEFSQGQECNPFVFTPSDEEPDLDPYAGSEWAGGQEGNPFVFTPSDEDAARVASLFPQRSVALLDKILGDQK